MSWGSAMTPTCITSEPMEGLSESTNERLSQVLGILGAGSSSPKQQMLYAAARTSPAGLAVLATCEQTRPWRLYQHLRILNSALLRVSSGQCKRLMVFMPPQHGKSSLVSQYFPAFHLGRNPDDRIILGSYAGDFAATWGRKVRDVIETWGGLLYGIHIDQRSGAADDWHLRKYQGGMIAAGRGGPIGGRPANRLIIDDPFKDAQEANSAVIRDSAWDWYRTVAYPRLAKGGGVVLVQTRWHEDDLAGRLLRDMADGGEPWEVILFEAINEAGEALCPELHTLGELHTIRRLLGTYYWSALYQQRPTPAGGYIFRREWFRYFTQDGEYYTLWDQEGREAAKYLKSRCWIIQTCDPAATAKEENDWFVLDTWVVTPDADLLLLDTERQHAETTMHRGILKAAYAKWHPAVQGVENKTFGLNIIQECLLDGLPVVPLVADTDKVARARPAAARMEAGTVYFLRGAPWLQSREGELLDFPRGRWDDQVDTTSYAAILLAQHLSNLGQGVVVYDSYQQISRY